MVSEKVLNRVKKAQDLIDSGEPLRNAYKLAHVDESTYKKYKDLLRTQNVNNVFKDTQQEVSGGKKPIGRPRKYEMKKIAQKISLEKKYIDRLQKEADEEGLPLAMLEARYIITALKKKYKDL